MRMKNSIADHQTKLSTVVVFRALALGDMLCSVPAFRALRDTLPHAHIVHIGLDWAESFQRYFSSYIDEFLPFPGYPGLPEKQPHPRTLIRFLKDIRRRRFDLAVQMHGNGSISNGLVRQFKAKITAGFRPDNAQGPDADTFLPYREGEHEIRRCLSLTDRLGMTPSDDRLEFPTYYREDREAFAALRVAHGLRPFEYVCLHPGASKESRRWPTRNFAAVADILSLMGFRVLLTGAAEEQTITQAVRLAMSHRADDVSGKTSLGSLAILLKNARLVITNDTGVSHLAAAVKAPSVVIFTSSDPCRWAPLDTILHQSVYVPMLCRPCSHHICPLGCRCARKITVSMVLAAVSRVLQNTRAPCHSPALI